MLKVLIVCNSGAGTSVLLKDRLTKLIPSNEYLTSSISKVIENAEGMDIVLTFEQLGPFVEKALEGTGHKVKTIEGFNKFAKDLFDEYLKS